MIEPKDAWIALDDKGKVGVTCVVVKGKIVLTGNSYKLTPDQFRELNDWLIEWSYAQTNL